jgi:hypothetical protein
MSADVGPLRVDQEHLANARIDDGDSRQLVDDGHGDLEDDQEGLGRHSSEPFEPYTLPGKGESGPECGRWLPGGVCNACGDVKPIMQQCERRTCSDCWARWARQASVRAATRVQAFRHTQPDNYKRQIQHAVVSAPEGEIQSTREFFEGKKKAAEIAESKGWRGFAVIAHPWRVEPKTRREYKRENPDVGLWVWLRREKEDIYQHIYWSPHYHIIGLSGQGMEEGKESDEWLYRVLSTENPYKPYEGTRDRDSHGEVYGTFRYLLSHTGWPEDSTRQAVTWYGCLANNVFVEEANEEWQHEKPSEGVLSVLQREIEVVASADESAAESDESAAESDEREECDCDGCEGEVIDVFDVKAYLRQRDPPPDVVRSMKLARKWRLKEVQPPPGAKRPSTREGFREAWRVLQGNG